MNDYYDQIRIPNNFGVTTLDKFSRNVMNYRLQDVKERTTVAREVYLHPL